MTPLRLALAVLLLVAGCTTAHASSRVSRQAASPAKKRNPKVKGLKSYRDFVNKVHRSGVNPDVQAIRDAEALIPKGADASHVGAIVAKLMVGMGTSSRRIASAEKRIPAGKWPHDRLLVAGIMASMGTSYARVTAVERTIPAGTWPMKRGAVATIMATTGLTWEQVSAQEKSIPKGKWRQANQRIVIAALLAGFPGTITMARIDAAEQRIPRGLWPSQRGVVAANMAALEGMIQGLAPADARRLEKLRATGTP